MAKERQNRVTIGGITLERASGGITYAGPIAQYGNVTDEHVQELWHFVLNDPEIFGILDECRNKIAAKLIEWGDKRAK